MPKGGYHGQSPSVKCEGIPYRIERNPWELTWDRDASCPLSSFGSPLHVALPRRAARVRWNKAHCNVAEMLPKHLQH